MTGSGSSGFSVEVVISVEGSTVSSGCLPFFTAKMMTVATIASVTSATITIVIVVVFLFIRLLSLAFVIARDRYRHFEAFVGFAVPFYREDNRVSDGYAEAVTLERGDLRTLHHAVSVRIGVFGDRVAWKTELRLGFAYQPVIVDIPFGWRTLLDGIEHLGGVFGYHTVELGLDIPFLYLYL